MPSEEILLAGDSVGLRDAVLLDPISEEFFIENLKKRYDKDKIYTFIGEVVVAVNPYRWLDIYGKKDLNAYRNKNDSILEPHIYAVAEDAFRSMRDLNLDQCIIISGESGAGKTEASKKVMHYVAEVSTQVEKVKRIKAQLLESNLVLEAFGNAKTNRNDNSSRFGKYMDMQFDFKADPVGGVITTYLLEKSRLNHLELDERNFHIFYFLINGTSNEFLSKLNLVADIREYEMLCGKNGKAKSLAHLKARGQRDRLEFNSTLSAMNTVGFSQETIDSVFEIVAVLLKLGNCKFIEDEKTGCAIVEDNKELVDSCKLLKIKDVNKMKQSLLKRTINAGKSTHREMEQVMMDLDVAGACDARDALSKEIYDNLFRWIVNVINQTIKVSEKVNYVKTIGVLDIYGFEIFEENSFEQFIINYCNEKLQQYFVEVTLKEEQNEYIREGLDWKNITYKDNTDVCEMIEGGKSPDRFNILAMLEEQCMLNSIKDDQFLLKLDETFATRHPYQKWRPNKDPINTFGVRHYAGTVNYNIKGFVNKNKDTLYIDLINAISLSNHWVVKEMFNLKESENNELQKTKRPGQKMVICAGTKFKHSMHQLIASLKAKTPHYIRCIKPNETKTAHEFNWEQVEKQVRYLGLVENVKVRRAGFAYRQSYGQLLQRYKMLADETWPVFSGSSKEGCLIILKTVGIKSQEYGMGKTKLFIENPQTITKLEEIRRVKLNDIIIIVQTSWRRFIAQKKFSEMKKSSIVISSNWRGFVARRRFNSQRNSSITIQKYLRGMQVRNKYRKYFRWYAAPIVGRFMVQYRIGVLLEKLRDCLPSLSPVDNNWPESPLMVFSEISSHLKKIHHMWRCRIYRENITELDRKRLGDKVTASMIFKDRKSGYSQSVEQPFKGDYLNLTSNTKFHKIVVDNVKVAKFSDYVTKYNRNDVKRIMQGQKRIFVITTTSIYFLDQKSLQIREHLYLNDLRCLSCSPYLDGVIVIHTNRKQVSKTGKKNKGDVLISCEKLFEIITRLHIEYTLHTSNRIPIEILPHFTIDFADRQLDVNFQVANAPIASDSENEESTFSTEVMKNNNNITIVTQ